MIRIEEITKNLLIINILIFIAVKYLVTFYNLEPYFILIEPGKQYDFGNGVTSSFKPLQIVTHMFMHADERHLIFNMFGLYMFGSHVEKILGPQRFTILYLTAGFIASAAQMFTTGGAIVGASGAIYGVLIAFATMFPNVDMYLMFIPIPIKSKYVALAMVAYGLYAGLTGYDSGIGHFAHLGGALVGFLLIKYWGMAQLR